MPLQNPDRQGGEGPPTTYLITWPCYGARLPGEDGAVPRTQNHFGGPLPESNAHKERHSRNRMQQPPYLLDAVRGQVVLESLKEACHFRNWTLLAAHVRTNHVHVILTAPCKPEPVMTTLKAYASRALNQRAIDHPDRSRWARHGSTLYLWGQESTQRAINYVVRQQGPAMAVFEGPSPR
jgi:REP element-mobilizing transposase RayT